MAFPSKSGKSFTNRTQAKHDDMRHEAKVGGVQQAAGQQAQQQEPDGDDWGDEGGQQQDGAAMAQEHGPAVQTQVMHDHEGGKHTVHAMHPDGHEHQSEHGSAAEAHKFAGDCAGCGGM
jgi:hypothetical protein